MKAIQVMKPGDLRLTDVQKPEITNSTEVLVRVKAAGICGSDVHIAHGTNPYATYPRILGHEIAGVVEEVGPGVTKVKPGDRVVMEPIVYCGQCYACKKGRPNVCSCLQVRGVHLDGGFADYFISDEKYVHCFPEELSYEQAAMIEPYTIGAQSNWRAGTSAGDVVLIHGAGPIGLILCDVAKNLGASCIVSEIDERRLAMAKDFGADFVINPSKEALKDKVMEITDGMGPNIVFEATGVPALLTETVEMVSVAGTVVPLSFGQTPTPINFQQVNKKEVTIAGTRLQANKFPIVISFINKKVDKINKLITHIFPAEKYEEAFRTFTEKDSGACKVILTF